jgi:YVTN family beta-propeller protein
MLALVVTTLLAMQNASSAPSIVPEAPAPPQSTPRPDQPAPTGAAPRATPTPRPRPSPTPPKGSGDTLVVVNKSDDSVSILDGSTGKLRMTVPVEKGCHEAEILPDGKVAAVSAYGRTGDPGRMVLFVELASGKVASRVDLGEGARPHGLHALPDGRLLVTAEGRRELVVVDPRTAKVTARVPTGHDVSHMVAASPDSRRAYVSSLAWGGVTVVDLTTGKVIGDVPTGKGAEGLDVTPDGREIWVANRDANTISIIDAKSLKVVFTIRAAEFPIRVKLTRDGSRAIVSFTGSGDVGVYDAPTRAEVARISIGRGAVEGAETRVFQKRFASSPAPVGILIAPDGKRAWIAATNADVVSVLDLERLRVADAWPTGHEPDGLAGRFLDRPAEPSPTPRPTKTISARPRS